MKYNVDLNITNRNSLSLIIDRIKPNSIILEFGPANGRLTKYLSEIMNCVVYCVEIDENAAKDAMKYSKKMLIDSIENYNWITEFKDMKFDYIIFADVLEHLYNPKQVLLESKCFLNSEGSILLSIPNIAHNSIIIDLMKNKFIYRPVGLLDETHIRFFTKFTIDQLIDELGLYTAYEDAIFVEPEYTELANSYNEVPYEVSTYIKKNIFGEVYQFIYELSLEKIDKPEKKILNKIEYTTYNEFLYVENKNIKIEKQRVTIEQKENYIQEQRIIIEQKGNYIQEQRIIIEQKENYIREQRDIIEQLESNIWNRIISTIKKVIKQ